MQINVLKTLVILITIFSIVTIQSCRKSPCEVANCVNGGCVNGTCICDEGFSGPNCSIPDDPCFVVTCLNDGECVNGFCNCETGWTGVDCSEAVDLCLGVDCNNGTCIDGTCVCDDGYDGTACDIVSRDAFIGLYDVAEVCDSDPTFTDNYVSDISASTQGVEFITIYNFAGLSSAQPADAAVDASVSGSGGAYNLLIDAQMLPAATLSNFEVSGSGVRNANTGEITIIYTIIDTALATTDPNYSDNCTQTYTPQ